MTAAGSVIHCTQCAAVTDPAAEVSLVLRGWSAAHLGEAKVEWLCPSCTRRHLRSIESRLEPRWW